ncbi:hypothetical protein PR048_013560 [Dryococelus australis]|uniref:DDE Tnp4 domain-containing protein n=1 Tax=Dryococelus australis TaxID=614101 RepID=A0ABQ9HSU1_9NEOP|nr:hypothetical protein PR048_013560 [Dryococelus australis]
MHLLQFEKLLNLLKRHILKCSHRKPLTPEHMLCMALKYLAQGRSWQSLAWEFHVVKSTVTKVIGGVCISVWNILSVTYTEKPTDNVWKILLWTIGKSVRSMVSIFVANTLQNRGLCTSIKKYFFIVLTACCDAKCLFAWVGVGDYGFKSNGSVFSASTLATKLCDAGGQWKIRLEFLVLAGRSWISAIRGSVETVTRIVLTTTALHNFIMETRPGQYHPRTFIVDENKNTGFWNDLSTALSTHPSHIATYVKNQLQEYFISEEGSVIWQWSRITEGYGVRQ